MSNLRNLPIPAWARLLPGFRSTHEYEPQLLSDRLRFPWSGKTRTVIGALAGLGFGLLIVNNSHAVEDAKACRAAAVVVRGGLAVPLDCGDQLTGVTEEGVSLYQVDDETLLVAGDRADKFLDDAVGRAVHLEEAALALTTLLGAGIGYLGPGASAHLGLASSPGPEQV